ncbi:MAG TPA: IS1 family transposase [Conexibacter sp.]|nr:IS1 family transposase [Conexibacter sp.]
MNRLSTERRAAIIGCLVEGNSIRATVRITGAAKNTVTRLLVDLGEACAEYQNHALRQLPCRTIEADEIWSFAYAKQKNVPEQFRGTPGYGDVWTWVALCADTKLVPSWLVGERTIEDALTFAHDLRSRLAEPRVQITTDGLRAYREAIGDAFASDQVDFAQLHKNYGTDPKLRGSERRYSPPVCTSTQVTVVSGDPDPGEISTSYVERQNLTMRMGMRRFTRLTNGFSKKVENLAHAVSLHYMHYNFARIHQTLRCTPAQAAGVTGRRWTLTDIAGLLES